MNVVAITGRIATEAELQYLPTGTAKAVFRLAVERIGAKDDARQKADYFSVVVFGKGAEFVAQHLDKGSLVAVTGRLEAPEWEKDGQKRSMVQIVSERVDALETKKQREERQAGAAQAGGQGNGPDDPFA